MAIRYLLLGTIAFLFCICVWQASQPTHLIPLRERAALIRTEYKMIRDAYNSHGGGWSIEKGDIYAQLADRLISLIEEWIVVCFEMHPMLTVEDFENALHELDADLGGSMAELNHHTFAIAPVIYPAGTFFVISKVGDEFKIVWSIKDAAKTYTKSGISDWSQERLSEKGNFPVYGDVFKLPKCGNGNPRFYINATYAGQGMTALGQLSVWEWNGTEAVPLFVRYFMYVIEESGDVDFDGELIRIRTKEEMRTFHSFGPDPNPVGVLTIRITPDGVEDLGKYFEEPDFQVIDDLIYRIGNGKDVSDIATPDVIEKLLSPDISEKLACRICGDEEESAKFELGGLFKWKKEAFEGAEIFDVDIEAGKFRFIIERRNEKPCVIAVEVVE